MSCFFMGGKYVCLKNVCRNNDGAQVRWQFDDVCHCLTAADSIVMKQVGGFTFQDHHSGELDKDLAIIIYDSRVVLTRKLHYCSTTLESYNLRRSFEEGLKKISKIFNFHSTKQDQTYWNLCTKIKKEKTKENKQSLILGERLGNLSVPSILRAWFLIPVMTV